jgi:hypothetical protein
MLSTLSVLFIFLKYCRLLSLTQSSRECILDLFVGHEHANVPTSDTHEVSRETFIERHGAFLGDDR